MRNKVTRREFLKVGGAVSIALLAGPAVLGACGRPSTAPEPERTVEERVEALLGRMTLDEKIQTVHGVERYDIATGYVPPIERLDFPGLQLTDGPVGVKFLAPATAFPATIALAATWDRSLAREEGAAFGREAKTKGHDVLLAPALNIDRVPVGGRTFEYYSEDPYLNSRMLVESIGGIQSEGIIATAKHYAANNQEANRMTIDARISERALREIYLPGFEAAVKEAGVGSVMTAYNKVNGTYCSENGQLLTEILKDEWGFEGFVVSDWGATRSTVRAVNAGLDLEMPSGRFFGEALRRAIEGGEVDVATLDEKVRRILRQMAVSGALDGRKKGTSGEANTPRHQALAREIAANGIVLLKRRGPTLPLDPRETGSIAVIGVGAAAAKVGGGGSSQVEPPYSVSILDGILRRPGSEISVEYASGEEGELSPVPSSFLAPSGSHIGEIGLRGEYFDNARFAGRPAAVRIDEEIGSGPSGRWLPREIDRDGEFSVRWTGTLTVPTTGPYTLALTGRGGSSRLYLDDEFVMDGGGERKPYDARLESGQSYRVRIEYSGSARDASVVLDWRTPDGRDPVELARQSDVAIVVATDDSTEGVDRNGLELPGGQDELISAVAAANDRTVVVLRTGGPVLMPWIEEVPNVIEAWYLGMEEGNAVASVLFGDVNPSGKLPVTFGRRPEDYPASTQERYPGVDGTAEYSEDVFVGYRHFDEQGIEPLFPFGHGLSYTSFGYDEDRPIVVDGSAHSSDLGVEVSAQIRNTGPREGAEVVQLYLSAPETSVPMPPRQLKGFQKVFLRPGQSQRVSFSLDRRALSYWDTDANDWVLQDGTYRVMLGSSSRDIRLQFSFNVV